MSFALRYAGIAALAAQALAAPSAKWKRQSTNSTIVSDIDIISQYWGKPFMPLDYTFSFHLA